jgi:signal transduction histidine kinase
MLWVLGVGLVFIILLHLYLVQRRKAYKKLSYTNKQLIEANERAEESERMKSKFIHQISHEVRTPLNVLSGFTQVLAAPDIEISAEELQSISKKIVENSERITRLVDKMLDLSLVNARAGADCTDKVSPADIAYQAAQQAGITQATHLDFNLKLGARTSQIVITTHLKSAVKALSLLLDNAQKFTHPLAYKGKAPEGKASVVLNVNIDDQNVIFSVEDTGIGVPADQAENIFTEFVQLDEYTDGTGIGLSIARSLARNLKGDIVLDTTYTVGARFVMQLPL